MSSRCSRQRALSWDDLMMTNSPPLSLLTMVMSACSRKVLIAAFPFWDMFDLIFSRLEQANNYFRLCWNHFMHFSLRCEILEECVVSDRSSMLLRGAALLLVEPMMPVGLNQSIAWSTLMQTLLPEQYVVVDRGRSFALF